MCVLVFLCRSPVLCCPPLPCCFPVVHARGWACCLPSPHPTGQGRINSGTRRSAVQATLRALWNRTRCCCRCSSCRSCCSCAHCCCCCCACCRCWLLCKVRWALGLHTARVQGLRVSGVGRAAHATHGWLCSRCYMAQRMTSRVVRGLRGSCWEHLHAFSLAKVGVQAEQQPFLPCDSKATKGLAARLSHNNSTFSLQRFSTLVLATCRQGCSSFHACHCAHPMC